jgi:hypothetical protein
MKLPLVLTVWVRNINLTPFPTILVEYRDITPLPNPPPHAGYARRLSTAPVPLLKPPVLVHPR